MRPGESGAPGLSKAPAGPLARRDEARRERGAGPQTAPAGSPDPAGMRARRERGAGPSYMAPAGPLARWDEARRERGAGPQSAPAGSFDPVGDEGPARAGRRALVQLLPG